jgi:hypothetical protein
MTQYDIFPVYEKVIQKDRVKYMHSNNGIRETKWIDGTVELYSYVDDKIIQKRS